MASTSGNGARSVDAAVIVALGISLIVLASPPGAMGSRARDGVNAVLGDASFVETFGRPPGSTDADTLRIRTHLLYVERLLRAAGARPFDDTVRQRRLVNLDRLHAYALAGAYPSGDSPIGRLPTFIDDRGRRCAVADLVERSAGSALAQAIGRRFRNAYIGEIEDPAFDDWIATSGLSRAELAMIQPTYNFQVDEPTWQMDGRLGAQALHALNGGEANPARNIAFGEGGLRWLAFPNAFLTGSWTFGADGEAGASSSGDAYYRLVARGGMLFYPFFLGHSFGIDAGVGLQRLGAILPEAGIVPFQVVWNKDFETFPPGVAVARLQLRGEGQFVLAGRDQDFSWAANLDLLWFFRGMSGWALAPMITVSVRELGGVQYAGVAIGMTARTVFTEKTWATGHLGGGGRGAEVPW
jgi:hypothetical protein